MQAMMRQFHVDAVTAMLSNGQADTATYQGPDGGALLPCIVTWNHKKVIRNGQTGPGAGVLRLVGIPRAHVANPERGGRLVVLVDGVPGDAWRLDEQADEDHGRTVWAVISDRT